jgi:hypothetical protein
MEALPLGAALRLGVHRGPRSGGKLSAAYRLRLRLATLSPIVTHLFDENGGSDLRLEAWNGRGAHRS